MMRERGHKRRTVSLCLCGLLTVLAVTACAVGIYLHVEFPNEKLDELLFYLTNGAENSDADAFWDAAKVLWLPIVAVTALLLFLLSGFGIRPRTVQVRLRRGGRERTWQWFPVRHRWIFTVAACLILTGIGLGQVGAFSYLFSRMQESEFFEEHYANPQTPGRVSATGQKRNLLFIELESMETSFFSEEHGGLWNYEVLPELYDLLSDPDAIFFATDGGTHGTLNAYGSTWTTAALISYTSGIPFKVPVGKENSYHAERFLKGAHALGDILSANGYRNILVSGAETSFGGVAEYFTTHGEYAIVDVDHPYFIDPHGERLDFSVPDSQTNNWGFSDEATFRLAQQVLAAQTDSSDEPWHLFVSTIDTHFGGYLYSAGNGYRGSVRTHGTQAENVYATTSRCVGEFIAWVKTQPFYENTTVVIVGDHPNMKKGICGEVTADDRGRYNLILNATVSTENTKNRSFTAFDFYPTVLAAMGFEIRGDRLGLGVNLFSKTATLAEQYGMEQLNAELERKSDFYIDRIMGRSDYEGLEG